MSVEKLAGSLEDLASALESHGFKTQFIDQWGWQGAPFDANDLAAMARQIAADITRIQWVKLDAAALARFEDLSVRVQKVSSVVLPTLSGGHMSLDSIMNTLVGVEILVRGYVSNDVVQATLKVASTVGRRVKLANDQLDAAMVKIDGLDATTTRILRAADAAEKIDLTVQDLDDAVKHASNSKEAVLKSELAAAEALKSADSSSKALKNIELQASEVMRKINSAYGAATTEGLAKSFDEKAKELNKSMAIWICVLLGGLLMGVLVGQDRFPLLLKALESKPEWSVVFMHSVISALSLGPGVWLAWIATKQIGQRFRLAEDYGYKASLAKAYEGYRTEAASLDPLFTAQLFAVALGRLEELPLRTIDKDVAGSPLNDLLQSPHFKEQIAKVPGLKGVMIGLLQRVLPANAVERWVNANQEAIRSKKDEAPGSEPSAKSE